MRGFLVTSLLATVLAFGGAGCVAGPAPEPPLVGETSESAQEGILEPELGATRIRPIDGSAMAYVPAGEFMMGSVDEEVDFALQLCREHDTNCRRSYFDVEQPAHSVVLSSFWIDMTEVTVDQYSRCQDAGVCGKIACSSGDYPAESVHPVVCVTWDQAAAYCEWAGGRLPTEAEWEYAARGPERARYPWGDRFVGTWLNYCDANCPLDKRDESFDDGYAGSAPIGSYPEGKSWVGALDLAGNVWELVADWSGEYPPGRQVNPSGPASGDRRLARGGSWHASPDHVRSALRTNLAVSEVSDLVGFRCAVPVR